MIENAPNINQIWARLAVEELVRNDAAMFCISPGSRSTPLALAVAAHPNARAVVHFDERGAAFHALGWASAVRKPAVLICTSGTAATNFLPAVVEAAQSRVPLLVLTADRPPELLDCGANQAIDQMRLFGRYTRWDCQLPCPDPHVPPEFVLTTVDQAVYRALHAPAGPVHLNCMFREPLAPTPDGGDYGTYLAPLRGWLDGGTPYARWERPVHGMQNQTESELLAALGRVTRGLLLVGRLATSEETQTARQLAQRLGWPVFADVASGLRLGGDTGTGIVYYDQLLLSEVFRRYCTPELVLHLGGALTSKRLMEHLAALRPEYVLVADHPHRQDPLHRVTRRIEADIGAFCRRLGVLLPAGGKSDWIDGMRQADAAARDVLEAWGRENAETDEILLARDVSRLAPDGSVLFLGNSMPIRDMDMYGVAGGPGLNTSVNRGASGIDGNIATAAGYAGALGAPATAIIGDLAALHDLNSLAFLRGLERPFVLVVVNNNGGGIFSFLPIAQHGAHFEALFATPHGMTFEHAARQFGLGYARPADRKSFERVYRDATAFAGAVIIEVTTQRDDNVRRHRALQSRIAAAVDAVFR